MRKETKYIYIRGTWNGFNVYNNGECVAFANNIQDAREKANIYNKPIKEVRDDYF